jgi:serine/threonine protein kinase/tetratricopeptide (TPR) repeat protein
LIGTVLGRYRVTERIGAGGMGVVYRAHDENLDRDVALKVLPADALADESSRKRLRKEAQALSKLNHPNIETLFELNTLDNVEFLVVEYIAGMTLNEMLARGALAEKEIARLGAQLADGLAAAHEQGVVHCDLKPGNLRVTADGRLKILDFGIAKLLKPPIESAASDSTPDSSSGHIAAAGTLPYMAPEQLQCEPIDTRSDIYATGAVLYEMATGERPFREEASTRLTDAILHQPVVCPRAKNARISPELERIILKCLEKDPENRYQTARELEVDLRQLAAPRSVPAIRISRRKRTWVRPTVLSGISVLTIAAAMVLLNVGGLRDWLRGTGVPQPIESLAVLPLENLSGDPEQEYFAEGMTEELITSLAKIKALRVASRTSVMQYKDKRMPLPRIARELGVDAVVEGSVTLVANRVRVTAQLIEGATDRHLWAESYERDLRDVLRLRAELASAIANEINVAVTPQERVRLRSARPVVPEAYEAYLRGRFHWNRGTGQELQMARRYFEQAVQIDPTYAPAYAGLADFYWLTDAQRATVAMPKAKEYALKALELDPNLAAAHTSLAAVELYADWNWREAEKHFRRALQLDPGNAEAHRIFASYLTQIGQAGEALAEVRRAQELDPLSISAQVTAGWTLYYGRRYDEAIEQCGKAVESEPDSASAHDCLGLGYLAKKMYGKAIDECRRAVDLSGDDPDRAVGLARAYALSGKEASARDKLQEWRVRAKETYIPSSFFAQLHVALGESGQGLDWLERAYAERDSYLVRLKVDPAFDPIRSDPRFQNLLNRLGLPP